MHNCDRSSFGSETIYIFLGKYISKFCILLWTLVRCLQTSPLLFFLSVAHCHYSKHHCLDENIGFKVKKAFFFFFFLFIRISLVCPINWLEGTLLLQLTWSFFSQRAHVSLKDFLLSQLPSVAISLRTGALWHTECQIAICFMWPFSSHCCGPAHRLPEYWQYACPHLALSCLDLCLV